MRALYILILGFMSFTAFAQMPAIASPFGDDTTDSVHAKLQLLGNFNISQRTWEMISLPYSEVAAGYYVTAQFCLLEQPNLCEIKREHRNGTFPFSTLRTTSWKALNRLALRGELVVVLTLKKSADWIFQRDQVVQTTTFHLRELTVRDLHYNIVALDGKTVIQYQLLNVRE